MKTSQQHPELPELAPEVAAVIDLFNNDLKGISFPDVSRETLASRAQAYQTLGREVAAAAAALSKLRDEAAAAEAALRQASERGLAYASIYAAAAADRQPLAEAVRTLQDRLHAGGGQAPRPRGSDAAPKRRGRKSSIVGETLFSPPPLATEQTTEFTCETGD